MLLGAGWERRKSKRRGLESVVFAEIRWTPAFSEERLHVE